MPDSAIRTSDCVRSNDLELHIDRRDADLRATLTDLKHGRAWGPVPLLELEVYAKAEFRAETVRQYRIDRMARCGDGFHVIVGDAQRGVRVGLWLRLVDDELAVTMQLAEVYEDKIATYRLFSVVVLPGLMTVTGAASRMLLPLNSGVLCLPHGKELTWDEPAQDVQRTTYADGTEVVADFGEQELIVNGEPVKP